jgi:signal peptidase I
VSPTGDQRGTVIEEPEAPRKRRSFLAELPVLIIIAFVLALLLKTFLIQAFYIPSASMEPTLLVGDRVLVNKVVYELRDPRRGEVVVFSTPDDTPASTEGGPVRRVLRSITSGLGVTPLGEKDFIKRVIGLPGETVAMKDGIVSIDGRPLPEEVFGQGGYLAERDLSEFGPVTVPEGQYFMMGDNRLNSSDSRFPTLGTIPRDQIIGRAFVVIWPLGRLDNLPRGEYGAQLAVPLALQPAA